MVTSQTISTALFHLFYLLLLPFTWLSLTPTAFLLSVLALGPLPKHVAFIMDGNRRWASSIHSKLMVRREDQEVDRHEDEDEDEDEEDGNEERRRQRRRKGEKPRCPSSSGHQSGFQALKRVLDLCLQMKAIEHVTVYAFAIDNFKRNAEEVEELMTLARSSLIELAGHGELLARHQARLKIVGRVHLLPDDVQEAVRRVEMLTRDNKGPTLNICIPYSSRDEMAGAVRARVAAKLRTEENTRSERIGCHREDVVIDGDYDDSDDLQRELERQEVKALDREMLLAHSPPVDVMVRTSGVHRLSDFMLWQVTPLTTMHFVSTYWPAFGMSDMLPILLTWQAHHFRRWLWKVEGGEDEVPLERV